MTPTSAPSQASSAGVKRGAVAGICVGVVAGILAILAAFWVGFTRGKRRREGNKQFDFRGQPSSQIPPVEMATAPRHVAETGTPEPHEVDTQPGAKGRHELPG